MRKFITGLLLGFAVMAGLMYYGQHQQALVPAPVVSPHHKAHE